MSIGLGDPPEKKIDDITIHESGEWYVARSETTGVSSQGRTPFKALAKLSEALELYFEDVPEDFDDKLEPSSAPWL